MTWGVCSGGTAHAEYGFSDDESQEVSVEVDSAEHDLEAARVARASELRKEAALAFVEYRYYNRMQLTAERGWDQYLPEAPVAQSPVPVIAAAVAGVAVAAGQAGQPAAAGFFARRPATAAAGPVGPAVPTSQVGLNEAPALQYDLMADLLHGDMFKVLSDMLRSRPSGSSKASQQSSDICP
jgi:hypothetical protein